MGYKTAYKKAGTLQVTVEGFEELDRVLKKLPTSTQRRHFLAALGLAAKPIVRDAKAKLPSALKKHAKSIRIFKLKSKKNAATILIGPDSGHWWMSLFEIGFHSRAAEPFLRPAWDKNKSGIAKDFSKSMWFVLQRMAKRLTKQAYAGKLSRSGRRALGL